MFSEAQVLHFESSWNLMPWIKLNCAFLKLWCCVLHVHPSSTWQSCYCSRHFFYLPWFCLVLILTAVVLFLCITLFMLKAHCLLQWWWITKGSNVTQRKLADKSINYPDSWPYMGADCCHKHLGLSTIHLLYYSYYNLINSNVWWIKRVI